MLRLGLGHGQMVVGTSHFFVSMACFRFDLILLNNQDPRKTVPLPCSCQISFLENWQLYTFKVFYRSWELHRYPWFGNRSIDMARALFLADHTEQIHCSESMD